MENQIQHGAIPINKLYRFIHKRMRDRAAKTIGAVSNVDWNRGSSHRSLLQNLPKKNQANNFSCGGQAGSYFLQIQRILQGINEGELSAKSIYAPIAYPGGGTTVVSLITQIAAHGANLEASVPSYDAYGNPLPEQVICDRSWQTDALTEDAVKRAGYTPVDIKEDIDEVAAMIEQVGAIIWEIHGQNGHVPGWQSAFPVPPSSDNPNPIWAHFMAAFDYGMINGKKYIFALQSEGASWGNNGVQYFGEDYFNSGHIVDCFTFFFDLHLVPNTNNYSIWAEVARYFRLKLWGLKSMAQGV